MNRRGLFAALMLAVPLLTLSVQAEPENREPAATILCYHVVESPADTRFGITRETFHQHLDYLDDAGYNVVYLADLYDYVSGKRESLPENPVVITIDDGWACTYDIFYKEMQRRGMPFTAFIYPNFINGSRFALTWEEIREMSDNGVDIQSHTLSHGYLTERMQTERDDYGRWLQDELLRSKKILEEKTGKPVRFLAYPYGEYDTAVTRATERAGYDAGLTCNFGRNERGIDPFRLRRVVIDETTTFDQFRQYLGARKLAVENVTPRQGRGANPSYPVVGARIVEPERVESDSVRLAVMGHADLPFFYDERDGSVSLVLNSPIGDGKPLDVVLWATSKETGERLEASWQVRFPASPTVADGQGSGSPAQGRQGSKRR